MLSLGPYNDVRGTIFDPTVMQKLFQKLLSSRLRKFSKAGSMGKIVLMPI